MTALRTASPRPAAPREHSPARYREAGLRPPRRQAPPPPVSDADLLEACRAGTRHARRLYARACAEWRGRYQEAEQAASQPEAELIAREAVRSVAEAMWASVVLRRGLGGGRP